jgi:nucleotide-binding universal stress UspA family protein
LRSELVLFHCLYESFHPVMQTAFSVPGRPSEMNRLFEDMKQEALRKLERKRAKFEKENLRCSVQLDSQSQGAPRSILEGLRSQSASLLIMGTHGRNLLSGAFFGSTARQMILTSPVPVITVRSRS